ncbi:aminotransferase class III-fold pyridoxal phosphate-dependent enzyme, partial [Streptomyces mobaraensis]
LAAAREITRAAGALLVLDEIQTGIGRTGHWFAHQADGVVPDVMTLAKGLGGGLPIGATVAFGDAAGLLSPGQHGSTFGGNPVSCAAALAVLDTLEKEDVLAHVRRMGERLAAGARASGHPLLRAVRGAGLLLGLVLDRPVAARVQRAALEAGFLVNATGPDVVRLAPPLVIEQGQVDSFVGALPRMLDV